MKSILAIITTFGVVGVLVGCGAILGINDAKDKTDIDSGAGTSGTSGTSGADGGKCLFGSSQFGNCAFVP